MPTSREDFPEIQLDEVIEDSAPLRPAAESMSPPEIDIDFADRDVPAVDTPSLDAGPGGTMTFEPDLVLDMSMGSLALDGVAAPKPTATTSAALAATKPPPSVLPVAPARAAPASPALPSKAPPAKPTLDLDSLLSDLDLGIAEGQGEALDLALSVAPAAREDPAIAVSLEEAPPLPLLDDEPEPVSTVPAAVLRPTPETLATLKRLAGITTDPEQVRTALRAALKGEPYDATELPPAKAMLLGMARVLVGTGYSVNEMVDAIIDAMAE